jgi:hypothetical protein
LKTVSPDAQEMANSIAHASIIDFSFFSKDRIHSVEVSWRCFERKWHSGGLQPADHRKHLGDICTKQKSANHPLLGSGALVSNHACTLRRDEAAAHHGFQIRKALTFSGTSTISITVGRSIESRRIFSACQVTGLPEAQETADDSGAGQMHVPRLQNDRLVKW